jgi:hypothetical protein
MAVMEVLPMAIVVVGIIALDFIGIKQKND